MTKLVPVTSSNIAAIGYDQAMRELHVKFHSGATHIYSGVSPEKNKALAEAKSFGSHFHAHIKGQHKDRKA